MDPTAVHLGNQKAVITACDIVNFKGEVVHALDSDEKWSLRFTYKINKPVKELVFGMGIFTLEKLWLFGTNSQIANTKINVEGKKEGTVVFECEPLNLLTGRYILQCSIIEPDTTPCDYYNEYTRFNVVSKWRESGFLHYKTSWHQEEE